MPIIKTKKELKFYIMADRILAGLPATPTIGERIKTIVWRILGLSWYTIIFDYNEKTQLL